jgi:hypothetical protein
MIVSSRIRNLELGIEEIPSSTDGTTGQTPCSKVIQNDRNENLLSIKDEQWNN